MTAIDLKIAPIAVGIQYQAYTSTYKIPGGFNSILFINYGTSVVVIDNMITLQPSQQFAVNGNAGEILSQEFIVTFTGGGTNYLVVVTKIYPI